MLKFYRINSSTPHMTIDASGNLGLGGASADLIRKGPWLKVFAYWPIKIGKKWFWLKYVFKREKNIFDRSCKYEYGTVFDVLRGD